MDNFRNLVEIATQILGTSGLYIILLARRLFALLLGTLTCDSASQFHYMYVGDNRSRHRGLINNHHFHVEIVDIDEDCHGDIIIR
jgi:multisubunit Na+/H+ antiporter MnhC subunit